MNTDDARRQLLLQLMRQPPAAAATALPAGEPRLALASFAQRRLWFIDQLQPAEVPYTLHAVQQLHFCVDASLLEASLLEIMRRHEVLRSSFALRGDDLVQRVEPQPTLTLTQVDLRALDPAERASEARQHMGHQLAERFDLHRGPLLRAVLYRLGEADFLLLVAVHHIVFDWQSFQVFFQELDTLYAAALAGRPHGLTPAEPYADFAREQHDRLSPARIEAELAFWRTELAGLPTLDLPLDRPRPRVPSFRGNQCTLDLPAALVRQLERRAVGAQTTLFTVLLAGLAAALGRACRQQDFALGLPVTGRDTPARQRSIGFYVDTLVVRMRWDADLTSDELLALARDAMRRVLAHRQLPFEVLVQHLQTERDLGLNPLFQVGFQLMQQPMAQAESQGTDPARRSAMFDLCIDLWPQEGALKGRLQFNADIFDAPTVQMLGQAFVDALHGLAQPGRRLSELALAGPGPAPAPSLLFGETLAWGEQTCVDLFAEIALRQPDAIAVQDAATRLSYRALLQRAEQWAGALAARGVKPGSIVVVELPRSVDMIVLQLAVWRAGAAFACLDPGWPAARRAFVHARTATPLVVDADALRALSAAAPAPPPERRPGAHERAYVISTSGSTGVPKAVVIEHHGLLNVALAQRRLFGLGPGRQVAQLSAPTFDASIFEAVLALCSGATLSVAPPGIVAGPALEAFLAQHGVDTAVVPPSLLATTEPARCASLRLVCVAGESCPADLAERFAAGRAFWNLYGPTETTIWASAGRAPVGAKVAIGQPIANTATAVVDEHGRVVPVGMAGELCIAGAGLAQGYLGEPDLTRRAFVPAVPALAAWPGCAAGAGRMYRSGDLVRQLPGGELLFLGRTDRQIKVRGLRIEPEEIERVLRTQPGVAEVLVDAATLAGETVLVAYLQTANNDHDALFDTCRERLRAGLPAYMCPSHYVALAELPRTSSGKIDRLALHLPSGPTGDAPLRAAPVTESERALAGWMQEVLHRPQVGADDDFFRIGGHSLAAAQLAARVRAGFGVELSIAEVFAHPRLSALAARIDALRAGAAEAPLGAVPLVRLPRATAAQLSTRQS